MGIRDGRSLVVLPTARRQLEFKKKWKITFLQEGGEAQDMQTE
jgi:hypothetical protein